MGIVERGARVKVVVRRGIGGRVGQGVGGGGPQTGVCHPAE